MADEVVVVVVDVVENVVVIVDDVVEEVVSVAFRYEISVVM